MTNETIRLPIKLSFRLMRADIAAFERLPREFSRTEFLAFFGMLFVCGMAFAAFDEDARSLMPESVAGYRHLIMSVLAAGIAYIFFTAVLTLLAYRRVARAELHSAETEIEASEFGLKVSDGRPIRTIGWDLIAKIIETPGHVFLCLTPRDAVIVPLRAFHSVDDMSAFATLSETLSLRADADV